MSSSGPDSGNPLDNPHHHEAGLRDLPGSTRTEISTYKTRSYKCFQAFVRIGTHHALYQDRTIWKYWLAWAVKHGRVRPSRPVDPTGEAETSAAESPPALSTAARSIKDFPTGSSHQPLGIKETSPPETNAPPGLIGREGRSAFRVGSFTTGSIGRVRILRFDPVRRSCGSIE